MMASEITRGPSIGHLRDRNLNDWRRGFANAIGLGHYRQGRSLPVKSLLRCPNVRPRGDGKPLQMLRLIVCDADVHHVQDFFGREGAKLLRGFEFKGGGGTDFRPAIAEAAKWKPDLLIYLTNL